MTRTILSLVVAGLFVAACGGSTPAPATPETSASSEPATTTEVVGPSSPESWSDTMSEGDKAAFMKAHVVPGMATVFQAFDATRYATFGCATCHGPDGKKPQEFLPVLTFKDNNLTAFAEKPEVAKWMAEKVSPEMATILGKQPFNPQTHEGFGCMGCHAISAAR